MILHDFLFEVINETVDSGVVRNFSKTLNWFLNFLFVQLKGTLMKIWKSPYMFVLI